VDDAARGVRAEPPDADRGDLRLLEDGAHSQLRLAKLLPAAA